MTVNKDDCVAPGAIVLCYLNVAIQEVDVEYDNSTRLKDFFFPVLLIHHLEPLPKHIIFDR